MNPATRHKFNMLSEHVKRQFGTDDPSKKFSVDPTLVQSLVERQQESSDFLKDINVLRVSAQKGQRLGVGIGSPVAGRTDTNQKDRETTYVGSMDSDGYECVQTNFDTHVSYSMMDSWSHLDDAIFRKKYSQAFVKRMALDRIMIGWNGKTAARETNRVENPLLQDVNIGWLEKIRLNAPAQMMGYDGEGEETSAEFKIGEGGNYGTLDAAVFDVISLLDEWHVGGDDLVLIVGRELWVSHGLTLYNESRAATERNALQVWLASQAVAGLKTVTVPFFPARGLLVTSYDNLSIYYQDGATRRAIIDNPKRDRIEEYLSSNDAYVVEDYGKAGGIRSGAIKLKNEAGNWY